MRKILLIDDEFHIRQLLGIQLRSFGYEYLEARDGEEGLEIFKSNRGLINLIITDLLMPRKDGYEFTRDVREIDFVIPIVWITASEMQRAQLKSAGLNVEDILIKPYSSKQLKSLLSKYNL